MQDALPQSKRIVKTYPNLGYDAITWADAQFEQADL